MERYTVQSFIGESGYPTFRLYDEVIDAPCLTHYSTIELAQSAADESNRAHPDTVSFPLSERLRNKPVSEWSTEDRATFEPEGFVWSRDSQSWV